MYNERVVGRSLFGGVDTSDGVPSGCVGAEPVDGFGGECDGKAGSLQLRDGLEQVIGVLAVLGQLDIPVPQELFIRLVKDEMPNLLDIDWENLRLSIRLLLIRVHTVLPRVPPTMTAGL